jgi:hypothetical protein
MTKVNLLPAFTPDEYQRAHILLASRVATMLGRKLEEGDWADVYCKAKGIPIQGWSNLSIDILYKGLGVEHKMLCKPSDKTIKELCGTTLMHPAATRSIRISSVDDDATEVARDVLSQYADLIKKRFEKIAETSEGGKCDARTGWLLWQESLAEFLYFEEEMIPPNPNDYYAEWKESGGGSRKKSKNLWVFENETGRKKYSITTSAGAKIQPYFDVPPPNNANLYYFQVQGEILPGGLIRIWITKTTWLCLKQVAGSLDTPDLSKFILESVQNNANILKEVPIPSGEAEQLLISQEAYTALAEHYKGVSDEHMIQLLLYSVV